MGTAAQMMRAERRARLMPPEERRRLIEAPMPLVVVHPHTYPNGGVHIRDAVPESGHRVFQWAPFDEEWCRTKWEEE